MPTLIIEDKENSNPIIFFGSRSWERVAGKDEEVRWLERAADRPQVTSGKLGRLLERITRHPKWVQTIDDNPELDAADEAVAEWIASRIAKLDKIIVKAIGQQREAKTDIGRALNEQKRILGHGNFQSHFSETLGSLISLRTAERYMKLARETDDDAKSDNLSIFKSASDEVARHVQSTTKEAREEANSQLGQSGAQKGGTPYKLPLRLASHERRAVDALQRSSDWPSAEQQIIVELRRLCSWYGVGRGGNT